MSTRDFAHHTTNNLDVILADPNGARCIDCLGKPRIFIDSECYDETTVICPLCGTDAVVPASVLLSEKQLREWNHIAFKKEQ